MRIFRRKRFENDMDTELRFHIDAYVEDLVRSGVSRNEAERRARVEFGALEAAKDNCRQAWGWQLIDELRADLRLTFRNLRKNPGFATIAILSLALGIGANTAIFGLVDAVMLRILPVRDPETLVFIQNVGTRSPNGSGPPYPCFELFRDKTKSFDGMAAFSESNMELVIDEPREQLKGNWVSGNYFTLLGAKPILGRTLSASDDQTVGKGGPDGPVAVISSAYWMRRFGGDRAVIGRSVRMNDQSLTIIGVMPTEIMSLEPGVSVDIAVPMALSDPDMLTERESWWLNVAARLKPGVSVEQARSEADALFQSYMADVQISAETRKLVFDHIVLRPAAKGSEQLRTRFSKPLAALMILVGLVLLTACANVANLFLARATARQKEFATRLAIGASCGRLIRQTLTEALVLVGVGAVLGVALASQGDTALAAFFNDGGKLILDLSMNTRVLLFTIAVSVFTGLAFGLLPAFRAARVDPAAGLGASSRSTTGGRRALRLGHALVILQVALSTVLLAGAALFVRSLRQLESVDLGFTRDGVLSMDVAPEKAFFGKPQWLAIQSPLIDQLRSIPGVKNASWTSMSPLSGRDRGVRLDVPGFTPRQEADTDIHLVSISPEYFDLLGTPLRRGRNFTRHDDAAAPKVALLNETAAKFYFGDSNPIGIKVQFHKRPNVPAFEVVGVVKDTKHEGLREQVGRFIYLPIPQSIDRIGRLTLSVRTAADPTSLTSAVRDKLLHTHSALLITNVTTMEKQIERTLLTERLVSTLSTAFGALALVLACIGLYGILAYAVTRRTNEIGIRMALGATTNGVIWSVLREALLLAAAGVVIGIPAVLAMATITKALLYGVKPFDLPAFASAVILLLACAAIAAYVPARRAGRLDPMSALRCE